MLEELAKLQNGTDIRGIAIETADKKVNLTPNNIKLIGSGFVKWLKEKINLVDRKLKIAVGMDSRLSGPELKSTLIELLINLGCNVYDCGIATTPAMFMTTLEEGYKCDGAIMITASHLPYYYNGLKFFTQDGGCEKEDIRDILLFAAQKELTYSNSKGILFEVNFIEEYSNILVNKIRQAVDSHENYKEPLKGFRIVVDAGNGAGGFFADKVLNSLGADTTGSQFLEPDGRFPNHIPNPENKEAMESIKKAVLANKADLGIIFDTDVDRAAIVDSNGTEINKNTLIALISSIILEEHPKTTIVTDSVTSVGLSEFINNLGGIHHRFKRGYKNVINEAIKLNNKGQETHLAIETSGHAALKENYFLDDGAYLIAKILIKMAQLNFEGKKLESLIEGLKTPYESLDFRLNIKVEDFREYASILLYGVEKYIEKVEGWSVVPNNYEGVRVACDGSNGDGWFLLRLSLHEPVLPLNVESDSKDGVRMILDKLKPLFSRYTELDISNLG